MSDAARYIALVAAGCFAGGALYVALVEQPARMALGIRAAAAQFATSYARAAPWQGGSAIVAAFAGVAWGMLDGAWQAYAGAACIGAVVPWTLLVMLPTNHRLQDAATTDAGLDAGFRRWSVLHGLRSALGVAAFALFAAGV
jgi:hypothetical protein